MGLVEDSTKGATVFFVFFQRKGEGFFKFVEDGGKNSAPLYS